MADALAPSTGLLTWGAEGTEGGRFHSRVLQFPPRASGLTLGRGYDMKERTSASIAADLVAAGVDQVNATLLGKASGLTGKARNDFVTKNKLDDFEITQEAQVALFDRVFAEQKADVVRIASKADVEETYGKTDFTTLDPAILDLFVDLKFRGDYTGATRKALQRYAATNDLEGLAAAVDDDTLFAKVPSDRFDRRVQYLKDAVAARKASGTMPKPHPAVFPPHVAKPTKGAKHKGHHHPAAHPVYLKYTSLTEHRQIAFVPAHLRYTTLADG